MADNGGGQVNSLVSGLTDSINRAIQRLEAERNAGRAENVQEFRKDVRKSSSTSSFQATDIGILARNTTRLNVVSNLAPRDPVDFYKFRVTTNGNATLGQIGDEGVRIQLQNRLGVVIADSAEDSGKNEAYKKLKAGELELARGDYVLRVSREKGQDAKEGKNYALQLSMGGYSQDFDTVAKQPRRGDSPWALTATQQAMLDGLNTAANSLRSIPFGQSGTQKLLGSFNLFV